MLHVLDHLVPQRTRHYAYDDLGRLVNAAPPSSFTDLDFVYDLIGNRTQRAIGPFGNQTVTGYAYVNGSEPVMASYTVTPPGGGLTTYTLQHDTVGNLVDDDVSTFSYSPANRMTAQDALGHNPLAFTYGADGLRVASHQGTSTSRHFLPVPGTTMQ
jgi:hypothetical protein